MQFSVVFVVRIKKKPGLTYIHIFIGHVKRRNKMVKLTYNSLYNKIGYSESRIYLHHHYQHLSHLTSPQSSQTVHLRAMNCSVKSFRCIDFLLPSQIGHGNIRNPPHLPQTVVTVKLWNYVKMSFVSRNKYLRTSKF